MYRTAVTAALLAFLGGCALFQKRENGGDSSSPGEPVRRVVVQFHLAGDSPLEGRTQMRARVGGGAFVDAQPVLTRLDVESARAYHGDNGSIVEIVFNFEGRYTLADLTRAHVGERLAILIDGELHSAPRIASEVLDGRAFISNLGRDDAEAVAASLAL